MKRGAIALGAIGLAALCAAPASGGPAGEGTLRTGTTGNNSELVKTIPIGKRGSDAREVVMSVQPGNLGDLRDGDRLEATAEVEVSVCLKPNELHGADRSCIGRVYGYNPRVTAELALGPGTSTGGGSTVSLGKRKLTCNQSQPNRNHHCVLVIDDGVLEIDDAGALPCNAETCHLNLILSAHNRNAGRGHKLVVGAASDGKTVKGDKGRIEFARFRPGHQGKVKPIVTEARQKSQLSIAGRSGEPKKRVIYSVRLPDLRAGEQLVVDGKMIAGIGHHRYNVFQTTAIVLSDRPDSDSRTGWPSKVGGDVHGQITEANGFNCTQGRSAHSNPCVARKVGALEISRDSPKTLFVNLVAGMAAQADFNDTHRGADKAKISKKGFLRVYRYGKDVNDSPPPPRD